MDYDPTVISGYARTPIGSFQGMFSDLKATELGAIAVKEAIIRAKAPVNEIARIYMGCVLTAGLGQAPARQAAIGAGLPFSVQATTINKMCGSGMQAAIMAHDAIASGYAGLIIAGGMESMTNAPYIMLKHRRGNRIGHDVIYDHMFLDGLEDAYETGKSMGAFAEEMAYEYKLSRKEQDNYALRSLERAKAAINAGAFSDEIVPVNIKGKNGEIQIAKDEQPEKAKVDKIPLLKSAFVKDGTITAANSSSISDGAAALVMTRLSIAKKYNMPIYAKVCSAAAYAHEPARFANAPAPAIRKVLEFAGWSIADVDLFEINEAFAAVAMIAALELGIPNDKLNVNGGATALGHPIGASGARILTTLIVALRHKGLKRGIAALCIGGGEATAMAIEII